MRRYLSILLISIYVLSFTELHHLLKLPILLEHFIEHRELNSDITFFEFLALHYNSQPAHDNRDMQLPFKDYGHCISAQAIMIPCSKMEMNEGPVLNHKIAHTSLYIKSIPSSSSDEIWQPPKRDFISWHF